MNYQVAPPLSGDDFKRLKASIVERGVLVAVEIDEHGEVIDGHNRVMIANSLGIDYPSNVRPGMSDAEKRILAAELNVARRHLTDGQKVLLGKQIEPDVAEVARARMLAGKTLTSDEVRVEDHHERTTSAEVARTVGLGSRSTYERGLRTVEELEAEPDGDQLVEHLRSGDWDIKDARQELRTRRKTYVHVAQNSGENEWYTPPEFIDAARTVMGGIDLDPASSDVANRIIQATTYYTMDDNGLTQPWYGRVWMNPPYAQPLIQHFADRLAEHIESGEVPEAIVLVNNATETRWFQRLAGVARAVCFPKGRVRFLDPDGNPGGAPLQGQAVIYAGTNVEAFNIAFLGFGMVFETAGVVL